MVCKTRIIRDLVSNDSNKIKVPKINTTYLPSISVTAKATIQKDQDCTIVLQLHLFPSLLVTANSDLLQVSSIKLHR